MTDKQPPKPKAPPGIEPRLRKAPGGRWVWRFRVRWTDPGTGRRQFEELDSVDEALDFLAHVRLARRRGALADLDRGREPLRDFVAEWWESYAKANLATATRAAYATLWNRHALGRIGHLELRQVTPAVVARLRQDLEADGVGPEAIRKTMTMLQAVFREAIVWERLPVNAGNPVQLVRKPPMRRKLAIVAFSPEQVEALRAEMEPADAVLISLLAYEGLRPEEALALEPRHVGKGTLLIEQKNVDGVIHPGQKTSRPPRSPELWPAVRADLAALRLQAGPQRFVFQRVDGRPWTATDYRNWRTRIFQPAAAGAGLATLDRQATYGTVDGKRKRTTRSRYDGPRPYGLRHTAASLLLRDPNYSLPEVAAFLGHDVATLSKHYAHIIAELKGQRPAPVAQAIDAARRKRTKQRRSA